MPLIGQEALASKGRSHEIEPRLYFLAHVDAHATAGQRN